MNSPAKVVYLDTQINNTSRNFLQKIRDFENERDENYIINIYNLKIILNKFIDNFFITKQLYQFEIFELNMATYYLTFINTEKYELTKNFNEKILKCNDNSIVPVYSKYVKFLLDNIKLETNEKSNDKKFVESLFNCITYKTLYDTDKNKIFVMIYCNFNYFTFFYDKINNQ